MMKVQGKNRRYEVIREYNIVYGERAQYCDTQRIGSFKSLERASDAAKRAKARYDKTSIVYIIETWEDETDNFVIERCRYLLEDEWK